MTRREAGLRLGRGPSAARLVIALHLILRTSRTVAGITPEVIEGLRL